MLILLLLLVFFFGFLVGKVVKLFIPDIPIWNKKSKVRFFDSFFNFFLSHFIEMLYAVVFVFIVRFYEVREQSFLFFLFVSTLILISIFDLSYYLIPTEFLFFIFALGCLLFFSYKEERVEKIFGFFIISLPLALLFYLSKKKAIGGGDIKLMAVSGFFLGYKKILLAFFIACLLALFVHSVIISLYKTKKVFAFGPYLASGCILVIFITKETLKRILW